jgi:hypothetical protein
MMINDNIDVHNGIANGTTAEFVKAYLKPGACSNSNVWLLGTLSRLTVDQLDFSGKIMTDQGKFRVDLPKVCTKLSFQ